VERRQRQPLSVPPGNRNRQRSYATCHRLRWQATAKASAAGASGPRTSWPGSASPGETEWPSHHCTQAVIRTMAAQPDRPCFTVGYTSRTGSHSMPSYKQVKAKGVSPNDALLAKAPMVSTVCDASYALVL